MPIRIDRWKCNHCKKHFASERYAKKHESICFFDPDKKACPTCLHFNGDFKADNYSSCCTINKGRNLKKEIEYELFSHFVEYDCEHWLGSIDDYEDDYCE